MINFGHRGLSGRYPENTKIAIKEAIECGATGIEIDVHKTKDNEIVVIHDEDIKRTFKGEGLIKNYTLKELKSFRNRREEYGSKETEILTLEEVILLIKDNDVVLNIELKTDNIHYEEIEKDVIELIKKYKIEKRVILSSFNHESIKIAKEIDSLIKIGVLYHEEIENVIEYAKEMKAESIHPSGHLVSEELISKAHKNNLRVNVYTVNEVEDMKALLNMNVDGIFTDYPEKFKWIIGKGEEL
ncbi:MAG: glycerophosphodiester phosphodiesterase [Clostridium sp.]